jgi:acetyl esterase/lipase
VDGRVRASYHIMHHHHYTMLYLVGISHADIYLAGDSAGGALAVSAVLALAKFGCVVLLLLLLLLLLSSAVQCSAVSREPTVVY